MDQVVEILKDRNLQFPRLLLNNYKKLKITDQELIMIICLINSKSLTYNPKELSNELGIKLNEVLEIINNLSEKGIISIDIVKDHNVRSEVINLDLLYEKLVFTIMKTENNTSKESNNMYDIFEKELGRGLTPMEFEILNGWLELEYSEEIIICALKEAIYNGATNFRYIDRILYEWNKKGIKTKEDVEKDKKEFKKAKSNKVELFDYDWLNEK